MFDFFSIFFSVLFLFLVFIFVYGLPAMFSVGPIPSQRKGIDEALKIAEIKKGEKVYDLGCGDGRVLLEAVKKYDCQAVGYELVFPVYLLAKLRAMFSPAKNKIDIRFANFFNADIENADVIFCFLTKELMQKIGEFVLDRNLKKGTRIISYAFAINNFKPLKKIRHSKGNWDIYLYKI